MRFESSDCFKGYDTMRCRLLTRVSEDPVASVLRLEEYSLQGRRVTVWRFLCNDGHIPETRNVRSNYDLFSIARGGLIGVSWLWKLAELIGPFVRL
jgi:hypothetical protein